MEFPVIHQIERIYYPLLAAVGVPVNVVAIVILSRGRCGLSKCITCYLVGMAASDLLVVITDPILKWTVAIYFPGSFMDITPVCSFIIFLRFATTVVSVWLTVVFTLDRFVAICCEKLKTKYCTEKTAIVVLGIVTIIGCLVPVPWYFTYGPQYVMDNVPWKCIYKQSFLTSPAWAAYELFHLILTPCIPVFLMLLLNFLTVRRILITSRVRKALRIRNNGTTHLDPEIENRKKSIVLLFSISGSFILLWVTKVVYRIYVRITSIRYYDTNTDPRFITQQTATMLQLLSTCTNTGIYAVTQTKFREELKKVMKYPSNLIVRLVKA